MRTLNISISDFEFNKLGLTKEEINYTEFIDIVSREIARQNLIKCIELSNKFGLSEMTMEDISGEVKKVREDAKNRD
jgi:hypothetical protein